MSKKAFCVYCFGSNGRRVKFEFDFATSFGACYTARRLARLADCTQTEVIDWSTGEIIAIYDGEACA